MKTWYLITLHNDQQFGLVQSKKPLNGAFGELVDKRKYDELKEELQEWICDYFYSNAHKTEDGTWDTMALSGVRDAGDRLVEMGLLERLPNGHGRRWFYREVKG